MATIWNQYMYVIIWISFYGSFSSFWNTLWYYSQLPSGSQQQY